MPIPVMVALTLGLKLAQAGFSAMQEGRDELTVEEEAALRAEGREHLGRWDKLFED